ncbi:MAG: beta-hydroxyacyl-ACP dehydratase [Gammaproteobacteria bacterium]|nr:beta-hydroxyacyl-ACP dehydratase [Gammaproteobacteria bacterium]
MLKHSFSIPLSHKSLPGHFPDNPIVPGVVLLDQIMGFLHASGFKLNVIERAKFTKPVKAGQLLDLECTIKDALVDYDLFNDGVLVATGRITITKE